MVQRRQRERSLFEVLLPDGHKLWPDWLRKIDTLLEDEAVIEVVAQALEARWPQSRRRGRLGHAGRGRHPDADPEASVRLELRRHGARGARQFGVSDVHAHRCRRRARREDDPEDRARARPGRHRAVASTGGRGREACRGHARSPISRRHHGRRNECALSDRQHALAGRGARADADDATGEHGVGRSGRAHSQSAAERDPARADHWVRSAIAKDAGRHGQELPHPDGDHARRAA